ncbi:hypothetical protein Tco_0000972 [Tanacetum coccineum]
MFMVYLKETAGYYFYNLKENKVFVDRNGHFLESDYLLQEFSGSDEVLDEIQDTPIKPQTEEPSLNLKSHDLRDHKEPKTYQEAMTCSESSQWLEAMNAQM